MDYSRDCRFRKSVYSEGKSLRDSLFFLNLVARVWSTYSFPLSLRVYFGRGLSLIKPKKSSCPRLLFIELRESACFSFDVEELSLGHGCTQSSTMRR